VEAAKMTTTPKLRSLSYFATASIAFCIAIFCTFCSFIGGLGWPYLAPSLAAVFSILFGALVAIRRRTVGARLSAAGAVLCTGVILSFMAALLVAIPLRQQPRQAIMLAAPAALLILVLSHPAQLFIEYKFRGTSR
jgi:hypothetical protein